MRKVKIFFSVGAFVELNLTTAFADDLIDMIKRSVKGKDKVVKVAINNKVVHIMTDKIQFIEQEDIETN